MYHPNVGINKALLLLRMWLLVFPLGFLLDPKKLKRFPSAGIKGVTTTTQ